MTAKQYLNRAYGLRRRIAAKELHLEELRSQAEHITADLTGMPRGSGPSSPVERVAVQIADLSWDIEQDWLDPTCSQLLSYRYISYKPWRQIAELMHYSERAVFKIHRKALRMIEPFIEVQ